MKIYKAIAAVFSALLINSVQGVLLNAQNPNFHIYLCLGQSNMEGHARFEAQDTVNIDKRFKVLQATDCDNLGRTMGNWYQAVPPLCRCRTGLSPADYFGRTMLANMPANQSLGIINVSIGGCRIELFDKENYKTYLETAPQWLLNMVVSYNDNPYGRLVEMAKLAQKDGVIKGILLHQGESNTNDTLWTKKVKDLYNNLLLDLNLSAENVPLLAGELLNTDQNGACASMNSIINTLPQVIPNAHIIPSTGCEGNVDRLHFTAKGYRELGQRYATKMLELLGCKVTL